MAVITVFSPKVAISRIMLLNLFRPKSIKRVNVFVKYHKRKKKQSLAKLTGDISFGQLFNWISKDLSGLTKFYQLPKVHKGGVV